MDNSINIALLHTWSVFKLFTSCANFVVKTMDIFSPLFSNSFMRISLINRHCINKWKGKCADVWNIFFKSIISKGTVKKKHTKQTNKHKMTLCILTLCTCKYSVHVPACPSYVFVTFLPSELINYRPWIWPELHSEYLPLILIKKIKKKYKFS